MEQLTPALEKSTLPSSTVNWLLPSSATLTFNSVPLTAAFATGVSNSSGSGFAEVFTQTSPSSMRMIRTIPPFAGLDRMMKVVCSFRAMRVPSWNSITA